MKIKNGFVLRDVGGKSFVVAVGELSKTFKAIITLNETGKEIWKLLSSETTEQAVVDALMEKYVDIDRGEAEKDVSEFVAKLKEDGILE